MPDEKLIPTPPEVPSFSSYKPKVDAVEPNTVEPDIRIPTEDEPLSGEELKEEVLSERSEAGETEDELNEHSDNLYGGPWEIIQYTGVARTAIWAVLTAALSGAAAFFFAPGPSWIMVTVFAFFAGAIAAVDSKTHLIKNRHSLITAAVSLPLGIFVASQLGWWNLLGGAVSAIAIMGTLLLLVIFVGFGSGGDLKFSPIPAFVLGVINPFLAALWFFLSLITTMVLLVTSKKKEIAFGTGMAIALPIAIIATKFFFDVAGLPYLEKV